MENFMKKLAVRDFKKNIFKSKTGKIASCYCYSVVYFENFPQFLIFS